MLDKPNDVRSGGKSRSDDIVRLWLSLSTCERSIEQQLRSHVNAKYGITLPQFELLCEMDNSNGPVVMTRLSEQLHVTGSNITGIVDRLEGKGLVKRFRSHVDRRVQHIRMTTLGNAEYKEIAADVMVYLTDTLSELTDEEVTALDKLLNKTRRSASKT